MVNKEIIKAIAFDFGGTLDSPFLHWMDIYLSLYTDKLGLPLTRENFRDSYVHAERMMEKLQPVTPEHSLLETQQFKTRLQFDDLIDRGILADTPAHRNELPLQAARLVTEYSSAFVDAAKPVLQELSKRYTLLLVSNYYGNIRKIAADLGIAPYFLSITDSTIEGVRKPNPALWKTAIDRASFTPAEVLVVGDSMKNDILPAFALSCQAVQGCPSEAAVNAPATVDVTRITRLVQLLDIV